MASVLIISHDVMGSRMAGPGIRNAALARVLMPYCQLTVAAPHPSEAVPGLDVHIYSSGDWASLELLCKEVDVIIVNGDTLTEFPQIPALDCCIVVDSYDPHGAEKLLWQKEITADEHVRWTSYVSRRDMYLLQCRAGDFFLCASEVQRDWFMGLLESQGRINPWTLDDDPSFRKLIDVVPYGLPSQPFDAQPSEIDGVSPDDKVLLWGGGVWPWLDAISAVRALPSVLERFPRTRLLFPGTRHPNPAVPAIKAVSELKQEAANLGLSDYVVFGDWVAREQWPTYLARADVGLSLHPDTIETHLAYRSRLFEYVWAGLPMVVTGGDVTSNMVGQYDLGAVVPYHDVDAVAEAMIAVLAQGKAEYVARFDVARADLTWERAAESLIRYVKHPYRAADRQAVSKGIQLASQMKDIAQLDDLEEQLSERTRERDNLRDLVQRYEQGRFMRLMRWLNNLKQRILRH